MNRIAGIVFLVLGIILLGWGLAAHDSVGSGISRLFTGSPTAKTIWLLVGGGVLTAIGLGSIFYPGRGTPA
ncbi:MAG TPA: DUF3185 family protein [Planctomycetota bacterium]|nr:DUF3185 family protein [Planctomycetota bacterium]